MGKSVIIKINFKGGIISPGDLYNILVAAGNAGLRYARFGLRQQLLFDVHPQTLKGFARELDALGLPFEANSDEFPNIVSSYPAEEIFINNTWLSEGVYKDILDFVDYRPRLKINLSDSNQSFTPMLTGNINWVASPVAQHFWHLFVRYPKTNTICEWDRLVYTNDVARVSKSIESIASDQTRLFPADPAAAATELFSAIGNMEYITKPVESKLDLPLFNLPYYEGLNRYHEKTWLGIYRRDELFDIGFLKEACLICLDTRVGQICSTPWKSIIIKGIEEKDRQRWNRLLAKFNINVRHGANELNFQVEDNCQEGLALKRYLVKRFSDEDSRTFGLCLGIKMSEKTEIFSSILIRRRPLLKLGRIRLLPLYDVLIARNFNPNERTEVVFSRYNAAFLLPEQLRRVLRAFHQYQASQVSKQEGQTVKQRPMAPVMREFVYQCPHCKSIYDQESGDPENGIAMGTSFDDLPAGYSCYLCETPTSDFRKLDKSEIGLEAV